MKLDVEFTQEEIEVLAQMAKRFGQTSKARLKNDNVEILLAEHEYDNAKSAMNKIADKFSKDGLYYEMANRHDANLSDDTKSSVTEIISAARKADSEAEKAKKSNNVELFSDKHMEANKLRLKAIKKNPNTAKAVLKLRRD